MYSLYGIELKINCIHFFPVLSSSNQPTHSRSLPEHHITRQGGPFGTYNWFDLQFDKLFRSSVVQHITVARWRVTH